MHWRILVTSRPVVELESNALNLLKETGAEIVIPPKLGPLPAEELERALPGIDAALASVDRFTPAVLQSSAAKNLKIISRWGVGFDSIDIPEATRAGVIVATTPGLLDNAVADYAFALLFAVARRVTAASELMRTGQWKQTWGHEISGKTLGIVGFGRIGQAVARRASAFGMRLLSCDISAPRDSASSEVKLVPLDQLLAESDFVTLHAASTPENRGLIGEPQLRRMKQSAYLINTARGALVDEPALVQALHAGWIAGAALDVFQTEPLPADSLLRSAPNLVLSPHQASFARETGARVSEAAAQAIVDVMNGRRPRHVVNELVMSSPALRPRLNH